MRAVAVLVVLLASASAQEEQVSCAPCYDSLHFTAHRSPRLEICTLCNTVVTLRLYCRRSISGISQSGHVLSPRTLFTPFSAAVHISTLRAALASQLAPRIDVRLHHSMNGW